MIKKDNSAIFSGFCLLVILSVSIAACTAPDNPVTLQDQQPAGPVSVTIHSADKVLKLNNNNRPLAGDIFLILNITVKNNDIQEGFDLADRSITLFDLDDSEYIVRPINSLPKVYEGLEHPIDLPVRIEQNEVLTGQLIFGIHDSTKYRLNLTDSQNHVFSSQIINFDNLIISPSPVKITIHSADKVPILKNNVTPVPGYIFLILNITVKNTDVQGGFDFTNRSITLFDRESEEFVSSSLNSLVQVQQGLENPIIPPIIIEQNEALTGQVIFGISDSESYRLNLIDRQKNVSIYRQIYFDNLITPQCPLNITINSVEKRSVISPTKGGLPGGGHIFVIFDITIKNNDMSKGFYFTGESIVLYDFNSHYTIQSFNDKAGIQDKLENPIKLPKRIAQNSTVTGNILFATTNSNKYALSLFYGNNTVMWSKIIYFK
jgi:hypothetical protein